MSGSLRGAAARTPWDALQVLMLASLATATEVGGNLQPVRIIALFVAIGAVTSPKVVDLYKTARPARVFLSLSACWIVWAAITLAWTPDPQEGAKRILALGTGIIVVVAIGALFSWGESSIDAIRLGWVCALGLTLPLAVWEIATGWHMAGAAGGVTNRETGTVYMFASATFGNKNNYESFMLFAFPFVLWSLFQTRSLARRGFHLLCAVCVVGLSVLNASRTAAIALPAQVVVFVLAVMLGGARKPLFWVGMVAVALGYATTAALEASEVSTARYQMFLAGTAEDDSLRYRSALFENGLYLIWETYGFGAGAGSTFSTMDKGPADTYGLVDPHSLMLEVPVQYGLGILGFLAYWLVVVGKGCASALKEKLRAVFSDNDRHAAGCCIAMLLTLPIVGNANSHLLSYSYFWAALGSAMMIGIKMDRSARSANPELRA